LTTAHFNLAVAYLLQGDYARGFPAYESRWGFEHLAGTLPRYTQPRWTGEPLGGKTIFVRGEQGHGDMIQFSRFLDPLYRQGARIHLQVTEGLVPLFENSAMIASVTGYRDPDFEFDYWTPIMSLPQHLGITLETLPHSIQYITAHASQVEAWRQRLGAKTRLRVGFGWSGRPDSWINQHKSVPFEAIVDLIRRCPNYEWINMQIDARPEQEAVLADLGLRTYPGSIQSWADTAGLMQHVDVYIGVDTALTHLAGAMGRPTWVMLSKYALDWRWLLDRDNSPWYATAKLFRQRQMGNWATVTQEIEQYLSWFKV
jgi:ADP-heptose:LPS heptosyltransferase